MSKDRVEKSLRLVKTRWRSRKCLSQEKHLKRSTRGKSSWTRRKGLRKAGDRLRKLRLWSDKTAQNEKQFSGWGWVVRSSLEKEKDSWGFLVLKRQEKPGNSFEVEISEVARKVVGGLILGWGGSSTKTVESSKRQDGFWVTR